MDDKRTKFHQKILKILIEIEFCGIFFIYKKLSQNTVFVRVFHINFDISNLPS